MSQDNKLSLRDKMKAAATEGTAKAEAERAQAQEGKSNAEKHLYQGNHVKRLVMRNGTIVLPNETGVFIPKTQEEYDMLEHMAANASCSLEKLSD